MIINLYRALTEILCEWSVLVYSIMLLTSKTSDWSIPINNIMQLSNDTSDWSLQINKIMQLTNETSDWSEESPGSLTDDARHIFELVNYIFLGNFLAVFGIISNVINIAVFKKQGLHTSVNIGFTGLAVSDLCGLVALLWFNICVNPLFVRSDVRMMPSEVQHLTGGWPHGCFSKITGWITVYITAERCLCITMPLKVKAIITPKRTIFTIVIIYAVIIASLIPEYATAYLDWKWYPSTNRTLLGLVFTPERSKVEGLTFLLYAIYLLVSFVIVIVLTSILVFNLKQKAQWRKESTSNNKQSDTISSRDKKTMTIVVVIAVVLIVCSTPTVIISVTGFLVPDFSVVGRHVNYFFAAWSIGFLFDAFNSSINIVLYYYMSSKYRQTFHDIFSLSGDRHSRTIEMSSVEGNG